MIHSSSCRMRITDFTHAMLSIDNIRMLDHPTNIALARCGKDSAIGIAGGTAARDCQASMRGHKFHLHKCGALTLVMALKSSLPGKLYNT